MPTFALFICDGSKTYNGKSYDYKYIKVIDNKGYNGLTLIETVDPVANSIVPGGTLIDWTLGNIFNVLNNKPNAVISSSNGPVYRITHTGVTPMTYYYLNNSGWRLIGVGAVSDIKRDDFFAANVNGKPVTDTNSTSFSTSTSGIWNDYVETYLANMSTYPSPEQFNLHTALCKISS